MDVSQYGISMDVSQLISVDINGDVNGRQWTSVNGLCPTTGKVSIKSHLILGPIRRLIKFGSAQGAQDPMNGLGTLGDPKGSQEPLGISKSGVVFG